MSGVEDWCIFDKLSPPKPLCQPHILNPSAQLLSHCPQYGLLAFTQGPTITLTTVPALVQWTKGGELLPKYEAQVESINNATHIVLGISGKVVAIGAGDDLIIMKTKGIIDGASTKVIAKMTLVSPIHYLEVSGDDKVLVLTKAGSVSVVVSGQKRDLQYANVQSCCFSVTDRELVLVLPGTFMLLSAGDFSVIQTCSTSLSSQIIGIRQVNPDFWAFVGIDTDKNTECFVINHAFFTGQRFEDSVCYHQGDDGSLNPLRPPQDYDLSALHCAYIQPLPERNCFLFCSTVSTTIEVVYFLSDSHTYARFETETSKIKGPLGFMMQENRRFDILCRGLVLVRSNWDASARFTYHYIDEDFDLPMQPLVLAMGMTGEVVSMRFIDLREEFCQKETVKQPRPLAEIPDLAAILPVSGSNLSLTNPNKPEKPAKQQEGIFSAFKLGDSKPGTGLFTANPPKEEAKSASKFPLPALNPAPTTSPMSFNSTSSVFSSAAEAKKEEGTPAAKKSLLDASKSSESKPLASIFAAASLGKEEAKLPFKSEMKDLQGKEEAKTAKSSALSGPMGSLMAQGIADRPGPDSYERQEAALYQYVLSQLQDLKDSISLLSELTSNPTLNESNSSAFTIKVKDLRNAVETDKSALERLNAPLKKLQQDQACNKLEFESLKHIKKQGLLRSLDQLLPAKMGKKLKMMEKRVVLLQEYEGAFRALHEQQNARLESLLGPKSTGIRQNTGPRALSRFNAPLKSSPLVVISSHKAANLIISAVQSIRHRLLGVASKLVRYQDKFRPAKQEKRFDFNEVEDMELSSDEEDGRRGDRLAYKPAEAHRDFEEAVQRAQRERLEEAKGRSASALTPLMRTPSEKDKGRLSVKPVQPLKIDFKVGAGPTQTITAQLEQFDALVKDIRTHGKPGDEGKGGQSGLFGASSAAKTSQFEGFEGNSGASGDKKPAGLFGSVQGKTGVQEGKPGLFPAATEAKPGLFAAPTEGKPGPLAPAEAKPAAPQPNPGLFGAAPPQKSSFFVSAKEGAAASPAKPGFSSPSPSETKPASTAFNPQLAQTPPTSSFFVSAKPGSDSKPMFSSFAPNPSPIATSGNTGFGGLSAFSKPSIPTALGGFSTANQGGGFKAVMEASSSSFAMFQNTQTTTFMQQAQAPGFQQGQGALAGNSDLFKPRK